MKYSYDKMWHFNRAQLQNIQHTRIYMYMYIEVVSLYPTTLLQISCEVSSLPVDVVSSSADNHADNCVFFLVSCHWIIFYFIFIVTYDVPPFAIVDNVVYPWRYHGYLISQTRAMMRGLCRSTDADCKRQERYSQPPQKEWKNDEERSRVTRTRVFSQILPNRSQLRRNP